jgi:soluble lytic murein transglycosylase-like protein
MSWWTWSLGFCAGAVLASWLTLSCAVGHTQSPEVSAAIHQAAAEYGVSERWMLNIARCESSYLPWVTSMGGHMGLYQYHWRTWTTFSRWAGYEGASPYDPWSAAMVTAWALSSGFASHWSCA